MLSRPSSDTDAAAPIQSVPELVHRVLSAMILNGELRSGEKIQQERVAARLGVSRVPVREALKLLEAEGLVEFRPRRGYIVASLDPDAVREVFDIRLLLEERAVYLGTLNRTPAEATELKERLCAMGRLNLKSAADIQEFAELNRDFHRRLAEPCRQKLLLQLVTLLRNKVEPYVRVSAGAARDMSTVHREHRVICDAFVAGDAEEVARLTRQHIEHVRDRLIRFLEAERASAPREAERRSA